MNFHECPLGGIESPYYLYRVTVLKNSEYCEFYITESELCGCINTYIGNGYKIISILHINWDEELAKVI